MGVISVRLDKMTETRLREEAKVQGLRFSDFMRKRLTDGKQFAGDFFLATNPKPL